MNASKFDVVFKITILGIAILFLLLFYSTTNNQRYSYHIYGTSPIVMDSRTGDFYYHGMQVGDKQYIMKLSLNGDTEMVAPKGASYPKQ